MIESGIQQLIAASVQFSAIAATRIYPVLLPTDSPLPAATYQVVSVTPLYDLSERISVTKMRLQVDAWGSTYSDARSVAAAIFAALDNFTGTLPDGTRVLGVQMMTSSDMYEHEALIYRVMMQYAIQYAA